MKSVNEVLHLYNKTLFNNNVLNHRSYSGRAFDGQTLFGAIYGTSVINFIVVV